MSEEPKPEKKKETYRCRVCDKTLTMGTSYRTETKPPLPQMMVNHVPWVCAEHGVQVTSHIYDLRAQGFYYPNSLYRPYSFLPERPILPETSQRWEIHGEAWTHGIPVISSNQVLEEAKRATMIENVVRFRSIIPEADPEVKRLMAEVNRKLVEAATASLHMETWEK